jgi:Tol biopolymer transport system component
MVKREAAAVAAASVIALVAVAILTPAPGTATFAGRNGDVAYTSLDGSSLNVVEPDGGNQRTLIHHRGQLPYLFDSTFSANGKRLAYDRYYGDHSDIYVARADGRRQRRLTGHRTVDRHPTFSTNGHLIAFDRQGPSRRSGRVFTIHLDGTHLRELLRGRDPSYSPDGKRIVFTRGKAINGKGRVFIARADGSKVRELTGGAAPSFSPNGRRVVFTGGASDNERVFTIGSDGRDRRRLTSATGDYNHPVYSPDGTEIAFGNSDPISGCTGIFVTSAQGGEPHRLACGADPSWNVRRR